MNSITAYTREIQALRSLKSMYTAALRDGDAIWSEYYSKEYNRILKSMGGPERMRGESYLSLSETIILKRIILRPGI